MKGPRLKGDQVVISTAFSTDVQHLIDCVSLEGGKAGLNIQSASRCSSSQGLTPAQGISYHQLGRAVDANLILPDGSGCDGDCMASGYCAFHASKASCKNIQIQPQNKLNKFINNFLKYAGSGGMEVGATFEAGDWNHFQRDASNKKAVFKSYQPQLKAFCNKKCPKAKKINPSTQACNCPGY